MVNLCAKIEFSSPRGGGVYSSKLTVLVSAALEGVVFRPIWTGKGNTFLQRIYGPKRFLNLLQDHHFTNLRVKDKNMGYGANKVFLYIYMYSG